MRRCVAPTSGAHASLSFCSGVFVLAATGLLDGRRATTHWRYAERLASAYPKISVVPDVLYIDEGNLLTAAGSAAGIDLSLHLIRRDWGAAAANSVARRLVVQPHRDGGQAQFIEAPVPEASEGGRLGPLLERLRAELGGETSITALAKDGRDESPHLPASLQGQHRHDPRRLARRRPRGASARAAQIVPVRHRGGRCRRRLRLRRHPAPPLSASR